MSDFEARARHAAEAVRRQIAELPEHHDEGIRRAQRPSSRGPLRLAVAASLLVGAVAIGVPVLRAGIATGGDSAASGGGVTSGGAGGASGGEGAAFAVTGALRPFPGCDTVLQYIKDEAPDYLISRVGGGMAATTAGAPLERTSVTDQGSDTASAADAGSAAGAPEHSDTNIQEVGVDEPDIVKTDGRRIVAVAQGRVHLISTVRGELTRQKTLPGSSARNVFLSGNRLLVFSDQGAPSGEPGSGWFGAQAALTMYDISSPSDPQLVATLTIDGRVLDARLVGAQVRVVTVASPDIDVPAPGFTRDGRLSKKSENDLRTAVARTTVDDWIPSYALHDAGGTEVDQGHLVACADLARPEKFSGLDTVAVSSFDMSSALQSRRAMGVVAGGQQIYATSTSTYVSTTEWSRDGTPATTSVHKFVTAASGASTYRGSGDVPGTLLNQYAMSEDDGVLRVASTISERRGWVNTREVTEGLVTTLGERDGALHQLGQIGGLGRRDNESIRAVRFIEDRGYVITFRQTDPLYVIDLRDAAAPRVLGELKIPGYSGYLHPIGKDLLLGVGQSGAESDPGAPTRLQFSLFDISEPTAPRRIDTHTDGAGAAAAEFDPKAFLYWQARDLVIAPVDVYGDDRGRGAFSGVVLLRATEDGLTELGKVRVTGGQGVAGRSFVIGDDVYLLSDHALQSASLDTLRPIDELSL
ncbi:MAG TPA: beta-propeller domain-containing protein [Microlunatus sp.]|nr:beta-propeller domain-containing protein [Microlunatus sp.]